MINWRKIITIPLINKLQGNKELDYLKDLNKSQFFDKDTISNLQKNKLHNLLSNIYPNVPYYRRVIDDNKINIRNFNISDLKRMPILTKHIIQEKNEELLSQKFSKEKLVYNHTGGSTGNPIQFYYTFDNLNRRHAAEKRHNKWAGYDYGAKLALVWGARRDIDKSLNLKQKIWKYLINNSIALNAANLTEDDMLRFIKTFNKYKPVSILAYAKSLRILGKFIKDNKLRVHSPNSIITSAELLTKENRMLFEEVFGCKVYDRYGAREFGLIASECEYGNMHVREEDLILEVVNSKGLACELGEEGDIVITDLNNDAFPLIRYKIGDVGVKLENNCTCGRGLGVIKMTSGRISDFIITPDNKKISGVAISGYVCSDIQGLKKVQFYQNSVSKVIIKAVVDETFTDKIKSEFLHKAQEFLDNIDVEIKIVDDIPVPESGKHQFIINSLLK